MAHYPIALTVPQYHVSGAPASGYVLKAYQDGTSTLLQMATDNTGGTLVNTITLNSQGYPAVSGNVVIPHVDQAYKLSLYPTQAAADGNSGAVWTIDNLTPPSIVANLLISGNTISSTNTDGDITLDPNGTGEINLNATTNVTTLEAQDVKIDNVSLQTQGANIASAATINLDTATGDYVHITGTTGITAITLSQGQERTLVFESALTLTPGASLIFPIPTGGNTLSFAAGDAITVRGEAAGVVRVVMYQKVIADFRGAYTGTLTGLTTSPTVLITYSISGFLVTLSIPSATNGTSNTTAFTVTGGPAEIRPIATRGNQYAPVRDNGTVQLGSISMNTSGTLIFGLGATANASGFTNSGVKGCEPLTFTYTL